MIAGGTLCALLYGFVVVSAFPSPHSSVRRGVEPQGHEYRPPGPFDSRSPCPGLNAMANHAYLPPSGMNISYEDINHAAKQAFNFAPNIFLPVFLLANQTFNLSTTGSSLTINLRDLARHNTIEQDGSLSRNDLFKGDDFHFDATVFEGVAASLGLDDATSGNGYVTVDIAAKAYLARQVAAKSVNPFYNASAAQVSGTLGTNGLYLTTLWDNAAGGVPRHWIAQFFQDRIPYLEGYKAPVVKTGTFLGDMVQAMANSTGLTLSPIPA